MKARYWIMWIVGGIIVLTLLSNLLPIFDSGCTLMGCLCSRGISQDAEPITGEIPCNTCTSANPVFVSILFNVIRDCSYSEIITCENGEDVGKRYDKENKECKYDPYILIFNLRQIGGGNQPVSHEIDADRSELRGLEF